MLGSAFTPAGRRYSLRLPLTMGRCQELGLWVTMTADDGECPECGRDYEEFNEVIVCKCFALFCTGCAGARDEETGEYVCENCEEDDDEPADVDGDGFVRCGECGMGSGDHATEDCPSKKKEQELADEAQRMYEEAKRRLLLNFEAELNRILNL